MEDFPPPPKEFLDINYDLPQSRDYHDKLITPYAENTICIGNRSTVNSNETELQLNNALDILLKNLGSGNVVQNYCPICSKEVIDTDECVNAINKIFHIKCFTCCQCGSSLSGSTFYYIKNILFCELDYLKTLETCNKCLKEIKGKVLRAMGQPYHPECFTCSVCYLCLDGVPFTLDAKNMVYCIPDFHKKYAPKCYICNDLILPDNEGNETIRIIAIDKNFHVDCFKCQDCSSPLSSGSGENFTCYPLDELVLCKTCNFNRINKLTGN